MIRFAEPGEHRSLHNIWSVCFGDPDFYISSYYQNRPSDVRSLVWEENGRLVSMLDLIPISLRLNEVEYPTLYIYAAATLPDYQGRRFMHQLIEASANWAAENHYDFLSLIPQNEGLVSFYQKQGFVLPVYRDLIAMKKAQGNETEHQVSSCSEEKFQKKKLQYEETFSNGILHSPSFCSCLYRQTLAGGGSVLSVGDRYAICYLSDHTELLIQEISSNDETLDSDVGAICRYYQVETATVARKGTQRLYGLFRPLRPFSAALDSVYMNTMLD